MPSIASSARLRRLFATSILARLPLEMLSIGLLVHAQHLTGSFAAAGVVTGVYAIALGVGGPLLGQLVDRRGQTSVLLAGATVAAALLGAIAVQPVGASLAVLLALTAGIGLATPPVGACLRTQLPALLSDPGAVRAAYALEASVVELTFIFGPPLALCIGALWSTGAALAAGGIVLLLATTAFAAQPASRSWRPAPAPRRPRGGSLRAPAMRTLVIVLIAVGMLLGADEVAVVAAAKTLDSTTAAAPLLAVWGVGSFAGGLLATRLGGGARTAAGLALVLGALTAGHLALIPAAGSVVALGGVLLLAGATIAPTEGTIYAMVDRATPAATMTEAFAWLATAMAVGGAVGAAGGGQLVDRAGPTAGFALAGGAGAFAALATILRSRTIMPSRHAPESAGAGADRQLGHRAGTTLELDDGRPRRMTLTIDAASLHTGISRRDKHLRSGDFFDTAGHPEVSFRSTSVSDTADNRVRVEGELDAAGARLAMTLEPTIHLTSDRLEVDVTTTVDQRQLGMTWSPLGMTRSSVTVTVHACLRRQS
jgi:predicted MFS family arabinose efflux permease